jgi:ATP-dependent RNA helicase RhlE
MSLTLKCRRCQNYTCTVSERRDKTGTAISFIAPRGEEAKVEIEVLMNMELGLSRSTEVEVSAKLEPEKERQVVKFLMKRRI